MPGKRLARRGSRRVAIPAALAACALTAPGCAEGVTDAGTIPGAPYGGSSGWAGTSSHAGTSGAGGVGGSAAAGSSGAVGGATGGQAGSGGAATGGAPAGGTAGSGGSSAAGAAGGTGGTAGGSSFGGAAGSSGAGGSPGTLGAACSAQSDCDGGLMCMIATSNDLGGGGPAKGMCTLPCGTDPLLCAQIAPGARCVQYSGGAWPKAYCMQACGFGPEGSTVFDPAKCHGRAELACAPVYADTAIGCASSTDCGPGQVCSGTCLDVHAACLPQCNDDADCDTSTYCDPSTGTCKKLAASGKGIGEPCTPPGQQGSVDGGSDAGDGGASAEGGAGECRGTCMGFTDGVDPKIKTWACAETCTVGAAPSCGWFGPGNSSAPAHCRLAPGEVVQGGGPGAGDRGLCGQLCDCNADCANPDFVCRAFEDPDFWKIVHRQGYCTLPSSDDAGLEPGILCG